MLFLLGTAESLIIFLALLFVAVLVVQIFFLLRVRRTLFQVNQFMKLMNLVMKEMVNTHDTTLKTALGNQQALQALNRKPIRFSNKKVCQNCRHRLSYVLFGTEKLDFKYRCNVSKKDIELSDSCERFETDTEGAQKD